MTDSSKKGPVLPPDLAATALSKIVGTLDTELFGYHHTISRISRDGKRVDTYQRNVSVKGWEVMAGLFTFGLWEIGNYMAKAVGDVTTGVEDVGIAIQNLASTADAALTGGTPNILPYANGSSAPSSMMAYIEAQIVQNWDGIQGLIQKAISSAAIAANTNSSQLSPSAQQTVQDTELQNEIAAASSSNPTTAAAGLAAMNQTEAEAFIASTGSSLTLPQAEAYLAARREADAITARVSAFAAFYRQAAANTAPVPSASAPTAPPPPPPASLQQQVVSGVESVPANVSEASSSIVSTLKGWLGL